MATESITFLFNAKDNASRTVKGLEKNVSSLAKTTTGIGKMIAGVAGGVSLASAFGKAWNLATGEAKRGLDLFLKSGSDGANRLGSQLSALGEAWDNVLTSAFSRLEPMLTQAVTSLRVFLNSFHDIFDAIGSRIGLFFVSFGNDFTHFFTDVIPARLDHARRVMFEDMGAVFVMPQRQLTEIEQGLTDAYNTATANIMREFNRDIRRAANQEEQQNQSEAPHRSVRHTAPVQAFESRVMSGRVARRDYAKEAAEAAKQQIQQNKQQIDVMKMLLRSMDDTKKAINAWTLEAVNI